MCGIACYWAKESLLHKHEYKTLINGCLKRGQDGIGILIYRPEGQTISEYKYVNIDVDDAAEFIVWNMKKGDLLFISTRATPETEPITKAYMLQPINMSKTILIHNGGVTETIADELVSKPKYNIDSELIIHDYYDHGRNMKTTMEHLTGSFAFVMLDTIKEKLYAVCSFNPLAHSYIRGYGYFYHSDLSTLEVVLENITQAKKDGMNVWESWYHHYLEGYTIIETDLQSGFQNKSTYTPRFLHPTWNCLDKGSNTKTLVCASGGVDSGVTAAILKNAGHDVELVHFMYGAKSSDAEYWAITKLSQHLDVKVRIIDVNSIFCWFKKGGMLTDEKVKIDSGGDKIKSTIAWVPGRNAIFASIVMALAEQEILEHNYSKVYISAGWSQLSEETGGYPDNSFQFTQSINNLKDYGYITGKRIEFLPVLQRLTKTETWKIGSYINFPFEYTVSCDNPKMVDEINIKKDATRASISCENTPLLCRECGSTKLSCIASDRAGVEDKRNFDGPRERYSPQVELPPIQDILNRLILPKE